MNEKYNAYQVLKNINDHIFFSKEKNEEVIYFSKKNDLILCFNNHFKSFLTENDFLNNFSDTTFYLYQEKNTIAEEIINDQYFRQ